MKYPKIYILVFACILVLTSCSQKHSLTTLEYRKDDQPYGSLTLIPSTEVFKLRHTIFKAERTSLGPLAKNNSKNFFSETDIGFDIGNHFFVDSHGNLSLRLDSVLKIDTRSDFKLIKSNHKGLPIVYTRKGYEYRIRHHGLFHFEWKKKIQPIPDGYIFGRKHIQKKISFTEWGVLENKRNRIHELCKLNANTCCWTNGKKMTYFYKNEETLLLPNKIRIVMLGSRLKYFQGSSLKGYIQKSSNTLFVHEIGKKSYTIQKKDNALELWQSGKWLLQNYVCYQ